MMARLFFIILLQLYSLVMFSSSLECPYGYFKLNTMKSCHPWLKCDDLNNMAVLKHIGRGAVKDVFLFKWQGNYVVNSVPVNNNYLADFLNGVAVLKLLNPSKHVTQFLGFCELNNVLVTEYHPLGTALDFLKTNLPQQNLEERLKYCYQYASILTHLHHGPAGRRVFCDSNSLEKLLSQLLVNSNLELVLNDVDAVPEVTNTSGIKCGHRRLYGTFVAPEQLWTKGGEFDDNSMPTYDEKTDIWKAAAICEFFIKGVRDEEVVKYKLFEMHRKCRNRNPSLRPSSEELMKEYARILNELSSNNHIEL